MKNDNWTGDLLQRKQSADFLYKSAIQRYEHYHTGENGGALTFAIDADWGAGKSFFIERWSKDIADMDHPTIHFDAWTNDLADEPLVGFLAQIKKELTPWLAEESLAPQIKRTLSKKLNSLMKQAGKAAIPATGIIFKSVLKKATGVALDEIHDALDADREHDHAKDIDIGEVSSKAAEKFFEVALKSHSDKQNAIGLFKTELEELIKYLVAHTPDRAPFFIFIDELDRCRPNYALTLLEGIKHLFNVKGVCFVVSTNLTQLSSAVKAVYGNEFDSQRYLKKFFNFEYQLPTPENKLFAKFLFSGSMLESMVKRGEIKILRRFPTSVNTSNETADIVADAFALIADSMSLDLRTQQQVFRHVEAAVAGYKKTTHLPCFYAFFLAAVFHLGPQKFGMLFDLVGNPRGGNIKEFIPASTLHHSYHDETGRFKNESTTVVEVLEKYHGYLGLTYRAANETFSSGYKNMHTQWDLMTLMEHSSDNPSSRLNVSTLPHLLRHSGYLRIS